MTFEIFGSIFSTFGFFLMEQNTPRTLQCPLAFQKYINEFLKALRNVIFVPYLDDIIRYSNNFEEHLNNLRLFFKRLRASHFDKKLVTQVKKISCNGHKDDPTTTEAIDKLRKQLSTVEELCKLLGFLGYKL